MRKSNKIIAVVLSISLVAGMANSLIGLGTTKAAENSNGSSDLSEYLNVYEDFEGFDNTDKPYDFNWIEADYGSAATAVSVEADNRNKWLKISGNNATGHKYGDGGRTDFSGEIDEHDGIAAYVYAEKSATFNFMFGFTGWNARTRTSTNPSLSYTLVTKDGKKSSGTGNCGIPLAEGFEGWVILGYDALTSADGWNTAFAGIKASGYTDLKYINYMVPEISNSNGDVYVDNIAFVKNCDTFINYVAPLTVYDYLNVYEGFDGYELGNTYALDIKTDYGETKAEATVKEKDLSGNRWLKLGADQQTGNNYYGHKYAEANTARTDFTGKIDDYNGMAVYVRAESDATFNLLMYSGAGRGRTRTATNPALKYTAITKNGNKTEGTGSYGIPLKAGFEGWIIMGYDVLTKAGGYDYTAIEFIKSVEGWDNKLAFIELMAVEITDSTAPVYIDDISFVTDTAKMIEFLAPTVVTVQDYLMTYENFNSYENMDSYPLNFTDVNNNNNGSASIETKEQDDKWIKFTGVNELGHTYANPRTDISGSVSECYGAAVYLKAEKAADIGILLKSAGGLTRTAYHADLVGTLITKEGKTSTITSNASGFPIPEGFEGWIVIEKNQLANAIGWSAGALDNISNINQVYVYQLDILNTSGVLYADNFSFVTDTTKFIELLRVITPEEYVKYYETFDGYEEGTDSYILDGKFDAGMTATATIEVCGQDNKWLKLSGNNDSGHVYSRDSEGAINQGWPRSDFSANADDYNGVSLYVKTEFSAKLNLRLKAYNCAMSRTAMNANLSYTLISKEGKVTKGTGSNGIVLPAGFEGTVILKNDQLTAASGWTSVPDYFAQQTGAYEKNLNWIGEFSVEITETKGAVYLDNYAFVTDVDAYIKAFKNMSYTYETGDINEDRSVDNYDVKLERMELVSSDKKMLQLDQANAYSLPLQIKNRFNPNDYNGFAMYIKSGTEIPTFNLAFHYNGGYLRTGVTGEAWTSDNISYTLISKHGTVMTEQKDRCMTIPADFEGWLVIGTEEILSAPGWSSLLTEVTDVSSLTHFTPIIEDVSGTISFGIGSLGFVKDKDSFVEKIKTRQSVGDEIGMVEDFESRESVELVDKGINPNLKANAEIIHSGDYAEGNYDVNSDKNVDIKDLARMKKIAGGTYTASTVNTTEIVNNLSVWNTPGLTQNKDFQFDVEATSTWASVTKDETAYYNALNNYKVGETKSLLPSKGAREWGYSLTHLDGVTDGAGNQIDFTYAPISKDEALEQMKAFIQKTYDITDTKTDSWTSMNSFYPWYHYAAEFGADVVSTEIGENQNNYQMHTAFVRGAGRQYGLPWGIDFSMWHGGYMYNPNGYESWNKTSIIGSTKTNEDSGHSLSLLERSLVMGYMGGANSVVAEAGGAMSLKNENGQLSLTDYGKTLQKVYQFTEKVDSGIAYTPIGIVLDYYHGSYAGITKTLSINDEKEKSFAIFDYDDGDKMTKQLMEKIWGEAAWVSGTDRTDKKEVGSLVNNSVYGDSFDILLQNASLEVLKSYPALVLSGNITLTDAQKQSYKQYVNDGGVLILNTVYTSQFGVFDETMPYGDGQVIVYGNSAYDLTGIDSILQEQIAKFQPVSVSGDIQYMTSMKDDVVYVTLINNDGVTKEGNKAVTIDSTKQSSVTIHYTGSHNVASVTDVYNLYDVTLTGQSASVTVPAGGIAVLEFNLK